MFLPEVRGDRSKEEDEIRQMLTSLAVENGYSGSFSPFEEEAVDTSSYYLPLRASETDGQKSYHSDWDLELASLTSSAPSISTNEIRNESSVEDICDFGDVTARDVHFKRAFIGGYKKSSVWEYVDSVDETLSKMKSNFEAQFRDLSAERARIAKECALLHSQIDEIESVRVEGFQELEELRSRNASLENQVEELSNCSAAAAAEAEGLRNASGELQDVVARQERALSEKNGELGTLTKECDALRGQFAECQSRIEELTESLNNEKKIVQEQAEAIKGKEGLEQRLAEREKRMEYLENEKAAKDKALSQLKTIIDQMKDEVRGSVERCERVERESELKSGEISELQAKLRLAMREIEGLRKQNESLSANVGEYSRRQQEIGRLLSLNADVPAPRNESKPVVTANSGNRREEDDLSQYAEEALAYMRSLNGRV